MQSWHPDILSMHAHTGGVHICVTAIYRYTQLSQQQHMHADGHMLSCHPRMGDKLVSIRFISIDNALIVHNQGCRSICVITNDTVIHICVVEQTGPDWQAIEIATYVPGAPRYAMCTSGLELWLIAPHAHMSVSHGQAQ